MFTRSTTLTIAATLAFGACTPARKLADSSDGLAPTSTVQSQRITGRALLVAPIANAHVTVLRLAAATPDEPIAETMTNDKGEFDLELPFATNGDLLVQVLGDRGGSTLEPVTGVAPISLSENDRLAALAVGTKVGDQITVMINPLSTLVAARSVAEFRSGARLGDAYKKNVDLFSAHFRTASPWLAAPVDLTAGSAPGLATGVIAGLVLIGLSQHALELGSRADVNDVSIVNSLVLLRLLVADLQDGIFDGKNGETPLKVVGNVFIDAETTRLSLAKSIESWLDSPANKTALTKRDVSQVTSAIREDLSELYPAAETPPQEIPETQQSGAPPAITITSPQPNQTLGTTDLVSGYVEDADSVSSFTLLLDGKHILIPLDTSTPTKWSFAFPPDLDTGSHVLQVTALDAKGNQSSKQVAFAYDKTAPSVSLVQCFAPDDRVRAATVTIGGATYANTTTMGSCVEGALSDGSQNFYTYADLYEEGGERAPFIALSTTDTALASATYVVKVNDAVVRTATPLPTAQGPAATHMITLSSAFLGLGATSVHAADSIAVEVTATDASANSSTRIFRFHLTLIPTPLFIQEQPTDAVSSLVSHTFAANNVQELFHQTFSYPTPGPCGSYYCQGFAESLIHVTKFFVVNVSSRPLAMAFDWPTAVSGSMSLQRSAFRTYIISNPKAYALGPSPCAEMTEVDYFEDYGSYVPNYATQTCVSIANNFKRGKNTESLQFTPVIAVYEQPGNVRVTGSPVTMSPGKQYSVVIAMYNLSVAPYPTQLVNTQYPPRDKGLNIGSAYIAAYGSNFSISYSAPTQIADENGFLGVKGILWNSSTSLYSNFRGYIGHENWYVPWPETGVNRTHLVRSGNSNYRFSPVVFEHSLTFSSSVKWKATTAMSAADPLFVGTGDHQPVATLSSHSTVMPQPNVCPYQNPLCNADMTGW
ncbi:MAG: hypothetical protein IT381_00125 [Deltaproteobacteria bacterium]|nr:hypothetical protein [Deltaproteobacteria bacterium]